MVPLFETEASFVPPFHSSNRYTPPLTLAAALIWIGELTVALSAGEHTFTPGVDGAVHAPPPVLVADKLATTIENGDPIESEATWATELPVTLKTHSLFWASEMA